MIYLIPCNVATCPVCDGYVYVEVYEWEVETGAITRGGFHLYCGNEPTDDVHDLFSVETYAYEWMCAHMRVRVEPKWYVLEVAL